MHDYQSLKPMQPLLSAGEHRELGKALRHASKLLNRAAKKANRAATARLAHEGEVPIGLEYFLATAEEVNSLKDFLDDVWKISIGSGCHPDHSPYYGEQSCSHCGREGAKP